MNKILLIFLIAGLITGCGRKDHLGKPPSFSEPLESIEHVLDLVDMVLIMTVNPGFGGQKFIHSGVEKTRRLRQMIGDRPIHIQIDGGVTTETAPLVAEAGADVLVAGSAVFKGGSVDTPSVYGDNIRALRAAAEAV